MGWLVSRALRRFVLLAATASLVLNLALLAPSLYLVQVVDRVFVSRSGETLAMLSLFAIGALALAYCMDTARAAALARAGRVLDARLAAPAFTQALLRAARGDGLAGLAGGERLRDIGRLRSFLASTGVQALFDAPWLPLYLSVITAMHPLLGAVAALGAASLITLSVVADRLTRGSVEAARQAAHGLSHRTDALLREAEAIVGMGMLRAAERSWNGHHEEALLHQGRQGARAMRLAALARVARQGVQLCAIAAGAWLVIEGRASPGVMIGATVLLGRALAPVEHLISGWKHLVDARSAWRRIADPSAAPEQARRLSLPAPSGRLEVEGLAFGHDASRRPFIRGIAFVVEPGESLGIVGASGSGKTTLVRLLLGLRAPAQGTVRLDGADMQQWNRDELGAHVGYLPQDVMLVAGTVAGNISRLGNSGDGDERVVEAARLAGAHEMILRLPQGYDTPVGDAGSLLSGGQRQRIALARAVYGSPCLVVLDEPNAHLDAAGEAALMQALQLLKARGATVIVVGHRHSLIAGMDKLAVLDDGMLAAFGPTAAVRAKLSKASGQAPHRLVPRVQSQGAAA